MCERAPSRLHANRAFHCSTYSHARTSGGHTATAAWQGLFDMGASQCALWARSRRTRRRRSVSSRSSRTCLVGPWPEPACDCRSRWGVDEGMCVRGRGRQNQRNLGREHANFSKFLALPRRRKFRFEFRKISAWAKWVRGAGAWDWHWENTANSYAPDVARTIYDQAVLGVGTRLTFRPRLFTRTC